MRPLKSTIGVPDGRGEGRKLDGTTGDDGEQLDGDGGGCSTFTVGATEGLINLPAKSTSIAPAGEAIDGHILGEGAQLEDAEVVGDGGTLQWRGRLSGGLSAGSTFTCGLASRRIMMILPLRSVMTRPFSSRAKTK
jgi:hypothetical protein